MEQHPGSPTPEDKNSRPSRLRRIAQWLIEAAATAAEAQGFTAVAGGTPVGGELLRQAMEETAENTGEQQGQASDPIPDQFHPRYLERHLELIEVYANQGHRDTAN